MDYFVFSFYCYQFVYWGASSLIAMQRQELQVLLMRKMLLQSICDNDCSHDNNDVADADDADDGNPPNHDDF